MSFVEPARGLADAHRHGKEEDTLIEAMVDQPLPESVWRGIEEAITTFEEDPSDAARAAKHRTSAASPIAKYAGMESQA